MIYTVATANAAGPPNFSPTFNQDDICEPGTKIVNQRKLADSLITQAQLIGIFDGSQKPPPDTKFAGQEPWTRVFTDPNFCVEMGCSKNARDEPLSESGSKSGIDSLPYSQTYYFRLLQNYVNQPSGLVADSNFKIVGSPPQNPASFLDPASNAELVCVPKQKDAIESFIQPFRLRGYPGQIAAVPTPPGQTSAPADDFRANQLYYPNQGAQLGVKSNSGQPPTSSLVGALGYQIDVSDYVQPHTFVVPYVALDRETNTKKSTPTLAQPPFSPNTFDTGIVLETYAPMPASLADVISGQTIALRPDYLWNWADGSQLASINLDYIPLGTTYLNQYTQLPGFNKIYTMMQLDLMGQLGFFTTKGHPVEPALNQNFTRVGVAVGPAVEFTYNPDYPIDISATYTDFLAPEGFHKSLGLVQAAVTWNFGKSKIIGITAAYINGRALDTAQRVQQWSIGLSLHY